MTVTALPIETTLSFAEQLELRKFMSRADKTVLITPQEPLRMVVIEALEQKGYVQKVSECSSYSSYQLIKKA